MLQGSDRETEILLGNKQLLGVFFVAAALLGIAFTGGYMLGRGSGSAKTANARAMATSPATVPEGAASSQGGETHSVAADDNGLTGVGSSASAGADTVSTKRRGTNEEELLGSRKKKIALKSLPLELSNSKTTQHEEFRPESGQEFLQVTALAREEANGVAAALRKKGFHAHAVPKPGNAALYRVIVGPVHDAGELSSTRDALRKTGFRDVIVQRY